LWGVPRRRKGAANTLAALKSIRAARPDGAPTYAIMDNLSAHEGADIRRWATKNKVELCFTPTYASWASPIEAHVEPLRQFTIATSNHPNHTVQPRNLHAYLRWCNAYARHATPTSWPPSARNAPASVAKRASARAGDHSKQRDEVVLDHDALTVSAGIPGQGIPERWH
jgi:hypothetical protein